MSAQIDNVRSSGSSFSPSKFAGALAKYRELGVNPYLLLGGQHFEGCFANGSMWNASESEGLPDDAGTAGAWSDEGEYCDTPLWIRAQRQWFRRD